jgi:hypothetical protein
MGRGAEGTGQAMGETKEARAARLAAALRENLKRRKAQSRAQAGGEPAADASPSGAGAADTSDEETARGAEG